MIPNWLYEVLMVGQKRALDVSVTRMGNGGEVIAQI